MAIAERTGISSRGDTYEIWLGANCYHYRSDGYAVLLKEGRNRAYPCRVTSETIKSALAAIVELQQKLTAAGKKKECENHGVLLPAEMLIRCLEDQTGGRWIRAHEPVMLMKRLISNLKKARPECTVPDEALAYLRRNCLVNMGDIPVTSRRMSDV
ncbi:TPA: hypothetical protein ACSA5U_004856 [Escherichia coli]